MSLTSVIIPARNEQDHIAQTIESYKKQQFEDFKVPYELIVVFNGNDPKDDTPNIVEDLGAKVVQLYEPNVSLARNFGVEESSGEILVFNDADTLVAPNYIQQVSLAIDSGKDFGSAKLRNESLNPWANLMYWQINMIAKYSHYFCGNCFLKRKIFESVGGYNENYVLGEDTELAMRVKPLGDYTYLDKTYLIPSERRLKKNGYFKEFWDFNLDNFLWLLNRKGWNEKHFGGSDSH